MFISFTTKKLSSCKHCNDYIPMVCLNSDVLAKKDAELKTLCDKLHATNGKLFESRNKIQQLQHELKNAHKVSV